MNTLLISLTLFVSSWVDNIHNPENEEFVIEVAFTLDIETEVVTQEQFNDRYIK